MHSPVDAEQRAQTTALVRDRAHQREAFDALFTRTYDELRAIAHYRLVGTPPDRTLDTTALVHEAYVRLVDNTRLDWQDEAHFLALAARAMRFVLVDRARARSAVRRGGGAVRVPLEVAAALADERLTDLLALAEALQRLGQVDARLAQVVDCRFFGGLSYKQIAEVAGCSVVTAKRDWQRARAWLLRFMDSAPTEPACG